MAGWTKLLNGSSKLSLLVFMLLLGPSESADPDPVSKRDITELRDGEVQTKSDSKLFCYTNTINPSWRHTWTRIQIKVWSSDVFQVKVVNSEEELESFSIWSWFQSLLREGHNETSLNINLFSKKTCFKVVPATAKTYNVQTLRKFDIYLFLVFLGGVLLFLFADSLSQSTLFFFSAGMSIGMVASLIIVVFILSRFLPAKNFFRALFTAVCSFSVYAVQLVCRNLKEILREHWNLALGYVVIVGFISFIICYRFGPLTDQKSINILSWTLQLIGLLLMFLGNQIHQVALSIIVAALLTKHLEYPVNAAVAASRKIRQAVYWKPEPRRLLTMAEYHEQGEVETQRALEELRSFCNSPDFDTWKAVSRLQSPKRFGDFVQGTSHLMPQEAAEHAQEFGLGSSFLEDELFDTDDDDTNLTEDDEPELMKAHQRADF
ncbi:nuclear envelope integral membrane protein 1 [Synchiropus splendidus]|uniref:nuclear envelope integral membrane protein 1 n=1 Tax=Synchiropus splendidus TaxID=270530 RepID=UPI00237E6E83|nr:nuclear envelope integral membrane protein 1 [Synchiropus splendidus]